MKPSIVVVFLIALCSLSGLAQEKDKVESYFSALDKGLNLQALEFLAPLSEEQKFLAAALIAVCNQAPEGRYFDCCSNLKNLGTALEMWATDNEGRYPEKLVELNPSYLIVMPSCPNSDGRAYGYQKLGEDEFKLTCSGEHTELGGKPPSYDSTKGIIAETLVAVPWTLQSLSYDELDAYSTNVLRSKERWARGKETQERRSLVILKGEPASFAQGRADALNSEGVSLLMMSDALNLMRAYFIEVPLVAPDLVIANFETMGPALSGLSIYTFVTAPEFEYARELLKKSLNAPK